ncbi:MAG: hypothetical protein L0177_06230 [Chloroflexi bacterium]|nr:hypothetical protein [Chloroflexota bacterium]
MKRIKLKDDAPVVSVDVDHEGRRYNVTREGVEVPDEAADYALAHFKLGGVLEESTTVDSD